MNLLCIGKLVNTHGIKGEVRIISDFEYKEKIFKKGNIIYIDKNPLKINTYRIHKNYDMLTFDGINDINDVIKYKGLLVYIDRNNYKLPILTTDLIGLDVYFEAEYKGKVVDILKNRLYTLLKIKHNKEYFVPNIEQFIRKIDIENNKIEINYIKGLEDEN